MHMVLRTAAAAAAVLSLLARSDAFRNWRLAQPFSSSRQSGQKSTDVESLLRACFVGYPNAGKSELTNRLVGSKVTAVSSKRNTTITPHLGAFTYGASQIILYDTPGIVLPRDIKYQGQVHHVQNAWLTAMESNLLLFVVDVYRQFMHKPQSVLDLALELNSKLSEQNGPPAALILNKMDLLPPELAKDVGCVLDERFCGLHPFERCFKVSARTGVGMDALRYYLLSKARPGEWQLPAGENTDLSIGELAVELVREKLYKRLNETLPYEIEPRLVSFQDLPERPVYIQVVVPVKRASMRKIVVGVRGSVVEGYVRARVQEELQQILQRPVLLSIDVRVESASGG